VALLRLASSPTGEREYGLSGLEIDPRAWTSLLNLKRFLLVGLMGERMGSRAANPNALSGVAGDDASVPKSSERSNKEYAAALSSLLSLACAMLAPDGDLSNRANPIKFELERLGINRSLYEVLTGDDDDTLLAPTLLRFCFIGDPGPLHDVLPMESSCKASLDIPGGRFSVLVAVIAGPPRCRPCPPFSLSALSSMRSISCLIFLQMEKGLGKPNSIALAAIYHPSESSSLALSGFSYPSLNF
jgi:hypothetical protein